MNITATLLIQVLAFVILIWLVNRKLWGPLSSMMEARQKRIEEGLAASDEGKKALERADQKVEEVIKEAKEQAAVVLHQAQQRASDVVEESKQKAADEAARILDSAKAEVEQEMSRAKEELRKSVSGLVVSGVEQILKREVKEADHQEVLSGLSAKL